MPDDLVTVATFADPVEANLARNRLEAAGLRAFLANEQTVDMDWLLGNALGWIRLEVADENLDAARSVLDRPDGIDRPADSESESLSPAIEEAGPEPESDEVDGDEDELEQTPTGRERDAERAFRGSILGILFFPIQLYVFDLLVKVFTSEEALGDRERGRAIIASVLCWSVMAGVYCLFRGW